MQPCCLFLSIWKWSFMFTEEILNSINSTAKKLINYIEKFGFWNLMELDAFGLNAFSEHFNKLLSYWFKLISLYFHSAKLFKKL